MMDTKRTAQGDIAGKVWPALRYEEWKDSLDTLHLWTQIVGKVKLALKPFLNDWWQVAFTVTARGLTTSTVPLYRRRGRSDTDTLRTSTDLNAYNQ